MLERARRGGAKQCSWHVQAAPICNHNLGLGAKDHYFWARSRQLLVIAECYQAFASATPQYSNMAPKTWMRNAIPSTSTIADRESAQAICRTAILTMGLRLLGKQIFMVRALVGSLSTGRRASQECGVRHLRHKPRQRNAATSAADS